MNGQPEVGRLDQSGNSGSHFSLVIPSVLSHCTVGSSSDSWKGSTVAPSRNDRPPRGLCRSIDVSSYRASGVLVRRNIAESAGVRIKLTVRISSMAVAVSRPCVPMAMWSRRLFAVSTTHFCTWLHCGRSLSAGSAPPASSARPHRLREVCTAK